MFLSHSRVFFSDIISDTELQSQNQLAIPHVRAILTIKRIIFSMLCNMYSKLIPTDHIYIHKYRNFLSFDMFVNAHMYLKSLLIV